MSVEPVRIVKVGGSLFELADLPATLSEWLDRQSPAHHVLVAGGGALADMVRRIDRRFDLPPEFCHWTCVRLLETSGAVLAKLLPRAALCGDFCQLRAALNRPRSSTIVFTPEQFLRDYEPHIPGHQLPRGWQTTTDSIAARLARAVAAQELVLLKSCDPAREHDLVAAAEAGQVDVEFPQAARELAVRWVNFRRQSPGERHEGAA